MTISFRMVVLSLPSIGLYIRGGDINLRGEKRGFERAGT
jgi:hypothetical protein